MTVEEHLATLSTVSGLADLARKHLAADTEGELGAAMEFVLEVLTMHFNKNSAEATHVMLQVHYKGSGIAGVYTRDLADSKIMTVLKEARKSGMPLKLTAEPE